MKYIKLFENFNQNIIDIESIKLDKEIVLVDTNNIYEIISTSKSGKMPLDKARVEAMAEKIKNGGELPPVILYSDNTLKDGHHRYAAYQSNDIKNIRFKYVED